MSRRPCCPPLRAGALLLALAAALACGGGATEVHSVRGLVVRVSDGGRSLLVDHEQVPGFMEAMRMSFPLQDPAGSSGLAAGDKIRFDLVVSRGRASIGALEKLPAETALALAEPSP